MRKFILGFITGGASIVVVSVLHTYKTQYGRNTIHEMSENFRKNQK